MFSHIKRDRTKGCFKMKIKKKIETKRTKKKKEVEKRERK